MSQIETTEQVPATTRTHRHIKCDICGKEQAEQQWECAPKWGKDAHVEVTVSIVKVEVGYESDGSRDGSEWDFCPECFHDKVRPLLETLAMPRKMEESW
jgi:hypothetical protein